MTALSAREQTILRLAAQGLTDAQIGHRLHLTKATVSGYMRSVFRKLEVSSRTLAVVLAIHHGLFDPADLVRDAGR